MLAFLFQIPRMIAAAARAAAAALKVSAGGVVPKMRARAVRTVKNIPGRKKTAITLTLAAGLVLSAKNISTGWSSSAANKNREQNLTSQTVNPAPSDAAPASSDKNYHAFAEGADVTVGQLMRADKAKLAPKQKSLAKIIDYVRSVPSGKDAVEQAAKNNVKIAFNDEISCAAQYIPSDNKIEFGTKVLAKMSIDHATEGLAIFALREELGHAAHNKDSMMVHVYLNEGREFKKFSYLPPEAAVHVNRQEEATAKVPAFMVLEELSHTPAGKKIVDALIAENPGNGYLAPLYNDYVTTLNNRPDVSSKIAAASVLYMHMMGNADFIGRVDAGFITLPDNQLWQYPDSTDFKEPTCAELAKWGKIHIGGKEYNFLDNLEPGLNDPYYRSYPVRTAAFIVGKSDSLHIERPEFRVSGEYSNGHTRYMTDVTFTPSYERNIVPPAGVVGSELTRPANDSDIVKPIQVHSAKKAVSSSTPAPVYE